MIENIFDASKLQFEHSSVIKYKLSQKFMVQYFNLATDDLFWKGSLPNGSRTILTE